MSANKEAVVQMDLALVGFAFLPHTRGKALARVVSTLISDSSCAAGRAEQNSFSILSADLFLPAPHRHMVRHLFVTEGNRLAPELCS